MGHSHKKIFLLVFTVLTFFKGYAQLSNFDLNVTTQNETCTANGCLNFSVTGTTSGSTLLYKLYQLPDTTTSIAVTSSNSFCGLRAGNYRVLAIQSLGTDTGSQFRDVTILNSIQNLSYHISSTNEICGNDATITIETLSGIPVQYEIISGPVTAPLQSSNIFTGLRAGLYQIRVFDSCGEGVVQSHTVLRSNTDLTFSTSTSVAGCDSVSLNLSIDTVLTTGVIVYPIQVQTTVFPTSGGQLVYNGVVSATPSYNVIIPFYANQPYNYTMLITDGCGRTYTINSQVNNLSTTASFEITDDDCSHKNLTLQNVISAVLISAPSGYGGSVPQNFTSSIFNNELQINHLVAGTYMFSVTNVCGNAQTLTATIIIEPEIPSYTIFNNNCNSATVAIYNVSQLILTQAPSGYSNTVPYNYSSLIDNEHNITINNLPVGLYIFQATNPCGEISTLQIIISPNNQIFHTVLESCTLGESTIKVVGDITAVSITSAPTTFNHSLPYDISGLLLANNTCLTMNGLPAGTYTLQTINSCGNLIPYTFTLSGYQETTLVNVMPHCGSFDLKLNHTSNTFSSNLSYWLQKFDSISGTWQHPATGAVYTEGTHPSIVNSIELQNNSINYNFPYFGHFRIIKAQTEFVESNPLQQYCFRTLYEFDYTNAPQINNIYSVSCGTTFEVVVDATGIAPLTYRITTKNGLPFVVNNGNSNIFTGLLPATYNFQVEDACGTILNSLFEVVNPNPMQITAQGGFCNGQNASLSVPYFDFLTYQWWLDGSPTTILSTSSSLNFTPFNATLHGGLYHVQITYTGNPNSCLNQVLDYAISGNSAMPNAGGDNTVSYCGGQGNINLFTLLQGSYDAGGTWTETTSSGTLTGNVWNATGLFGTFQFKYRVNGLCNLIDEATVIITVKPIPQTPTATSVSSICSGQTLSLFASSILGATYHWSGPNGFVSTLQNPIITNVTSLNSGNYSVYVTQNGCNSTSSSTQVSVVTAVSPNAGGDNIVSYCGDQGNINLFTLLQGSYDAGGTWTETTSSGTLTGNVWNATGLFGTYQFKYRVNGLCNLFDEATVTISVKPIPQTPLASVDSAVCETYNFNLYATTVTNATYFWSGPNGFTSTLQNPTITSASSIHSGIYSVYVVLNGCQSATSTVNVAVNPLPNFTLSQYCNELNYTLEAQIDSNTVATNTLNYSWTGPNNFTSNQNPTIITYATPGTYNLTVSDANGCSMTKSIEVLRTICFIPNAITPNDDGSNDEFNLTGFDVDILKIYNRWGKEVYNKENYINEWKGQNNNEEPLPEGTYFYVIQFKNDLKNISGWIYLGR